MAAKLFNLIAIATLAILASTHGPSPVTAISVDHHHIARHNVARHDMIARRQPEPTPTTRRRCKARPSSAVILPTPAPQQPSAKPEAPKPEQPKPEQPKPEQPKPEQPKPEQPKPEQPKPEQPKPEQPKPEQPAPSPSPKPQPPPSPSPSPSPAPPPPPPPPSNNGSKKVGIAWANSNDNELANFLVGKVSAVYTWSPYKPPVLNNRPDIDFLPMLWGTKQIDQFRRLVVPGYARYVLGFNEPDQGGQSNINPWYAADVWMQHIQPLKSQGYTLVSPAPTNAPAGLQWLRDFMSACNQKGCTVDIIATHWYGTRSQDFISHVENYRNIFNKEIWVTEFACQNFSGGAQCSVDQIWSFLRTVTNWMDNTWYVGRYFAFGVLHDMGNVNWANQLMNSRGQPNDLGYEYLY